MRMFKTDYSKSEEMAKDMFKTVDNIVMQVKETQDEFIFSTLSKYSMDNFNTVVKKEELNDAYRKGFQDGVTKEHDRIMSILERKENQNEWRCKSLLER